MHFEKATIAYASPSPVDAGKASKSVVNINPLYKSKYNTNYYYLNQLFDNQNYTLRTLSVLITPLLQSHCQQDIGKHLYL